MGKIAKYNTFKAISTLLTVGTPILTICSCSDLIVHRSDTAISTAGMFAILISLLFAKDKIAEHLKMPSAFVLSTVVFILIIMLESILLPMKYVCIATMCTSGIDELTFKRFYKTIEVSLPENVSHKKVAGFIFGTTKSLGE